MLEEIDFQDSGNQVSVTIDNETQSLPIKKINKLSTYIGLNQSLNTALENNIEVDAFIYYIKKSEEPDIENSEINTLNDLKQKRIGVQSSTKAEDIFSLKEDEKLT